MRLLTWLLRHLERPHAGRLVIGLAILLSAPALAAPLVADEHLQAVRWRQADLLHFLGDAFVFASGDTGEGRARMEHLGTWWAAADFRLAFFRPLSAATHALDLWLWPDGAVPMHAHTLLWLALLLVLLDALYRRFFPRPVAFLALALFAWDDARGGLLSWVANRHALIAACFVVGTLIAHDRWRRDGWRAGAWLGPMSFALGMLASEAAIAAVGFLAAHALIVDREGPPWRRLARLGPYAAIAIVWQAFYSGGGFGVVASGSYVHPIAEPFEYLTVVPARAAVLALGQLTPVASDFWIFYPSAVRAGVLAVGGVFLAAVARLVWPRLREPGARALAVGAVLALLPAAAAAPGDRNLTMVGIGASAALAVALAAVAREAERHRSVWLVAMALLVSSLVLSPLFLPLKCLASFNLDAMRAGADEAVPRDAGVAEQTLVVVSAASEGPVFFAWTHREAHGIPTPRSTLILSTGLGSTTVTRTDAATLRVVPEGGFLASEMQRMMRSSTRPFHAGEVIELSGVRVTIVETTDDGRARAVDFRFATPLEASSRLWMRGQGTSLVRWSPPAMGETVVVAPPL